MNIPPVPPESDWFPVRITAVLDGPGYVFTEVWTTVGGAVADRVGGRVNSTSDLAYAIDGSEFVTTQAGSPVEAMARRSPGSGGTTWELIKAGSVVGEVITSSRGTDTTQTGWVIPSALTPIETGNRIYFANFFIPNPSVAPVYLYLGIGQWDSAFDDPNAAPYITFGPGVSFSQVTVNAAGQYSTFAYLPSASGFHVAPLYKVVGGTMGGGGSILHFSHIAAAES